MRGLDAGGRLTPLALEMRVSDLPEMRCDDNCGKCCGPVVVTEQEYGQILRYMKDHGIVPKENGLTCPLYQEGRCQIYPVRPTLCRLFGHTKKMKCERGYNVNLPNKKIRKILLRSGKATRLLHHLLKTEEELVCHYSSK